MSQNDLTRLRVVTLLLVSCWLFASACSSGGPPSDHSPSDSGGSSVDPCHIVFWWADTSGTVPVPIDAPESLQQAQGIADSLPPDEGQAFLQLYKDLASDMNDAAFVSEASRFEASYCL